MFLADFPTSRDKMGNLGRAGQYIVYRRSILRSPRGLDVFYQRVIFGVCTTKNCTCYCERSKK